MCVCVCVYCCSVMFPFTLKSMTAWEEGESLHASQTGRLDSAGSVRAAATTRLDFWFSYFLKSPKLHTMLSSRTSELDSNTALMAMLKCFGTQSGTSVQVYCTAYWTYYIKTTFLLSSHQIWLIYSFTLTSLFYFKFIFIVLELKFFSQPGVK